MTFDEALGVVSDLERPPVKQHRPVDGYGWMPVTSGLASECPSHGLHLAAPRQGTAVCPDALGVASSSGREEGSCLHSLPLCFQRGRWSVSSMRWPGVRGMSRPHQSVVTGTSPGLGCCWVGLLDPGCTLSWLLGPEDPSGTFLRP